MSWGAACVAIVSGLCALIYEVVWARVVAYNFGGDNVSRAIVSSTFLLGLGIGAYLFRRRPARPFRTYALVELAIGVFGIASYYIISPLGEAFVGYLDLSIDQVESLRYPLIASCVLLLLPPCILMGGTLPLMISCFVPSDYKSATVGWIYGANVAGAALGTLAGPYVLLSRWSLPGALGLTGAVNIGLALALALLGWRVHAPAAATSAARPSRQLVTLACASGIVAMLFQLSLYRAMTVANPSSPYNFAFVLAPLLLASALGSFCFTRFASGKTGDELRRSGAQARTGWLFVATSFAIIASVHFSASLLSADTRVFQPPPDELDVFYFRAEITLWPTLLFIAILTIPAPFALGGIFPLLLAMASPAGEQLPPQTGRLYLANSFGAFTAAVFAQVVGFAYLGSRGTLALTCVLAAAAGAWCLVRSTGRSRWLAAPALLAPCLVFLLVPDATWRAYIFGRFGVDYANVDRVEGVTGSAVVAWEPDGKTGHVVVDGQYMSTLPRAAEHVMTVSYALALPKRARVLVLGLGGANIVQDLVEDAVVQQVDVVDWSYELPAVLRLKASQTVLHGALASPKVRVIRADARIALAAYRAGSFDVVIDNLASAEWIGATGIRSTTYFRRLARVLAAHGVLVFAKNYGRRRKALLATLRSVFPVVREHGRGSAAACAGAPFAFDRDAAEAALAPRAAWIGVQHPPFADWLLTGWTTIGADDVAGAAPIEDGFLGTLEYRADPM